MIKAENNMLTFLVFVSVILTTMFIAFGGLDIPKEIKTLATYGIIAETLIYLIIFAIMNHERT